MSISSLVVDLRQLLFIKNLTRNEEIENTLVWVLSDIWRLEQVRDTNCGMNVSNKKWFNSAKWQIYRFSRFWVIKGKSTGGAKILPLNRNYAAIVRNKKLENMLNNLIYLISAICSINSVIPWGWNLTVCTRRLDAQKTLTNILYKNCGESNV